MDAAEQVGQDRDGGQGDQDGADHMAGDPAGDGQEQGAGAVHHLLQIEGHAAGAVRECGESQTGALMPGGWFS